MTRIILSSALLPLCVLLAGDPAAAGTWEAIERLPDQTPMTVQVEGKPRLYFRISPEHALVVPIEGPARLRLTSRVEYPGRRGSPTSYTVRVLDGTHELERQTTGTTPSDQVRGPAGSATLGRSRRMTVDVPPGRHELQIAVQEAPAILVRLHQAAPRRDEDHMVSLTPIEMPRSVMVVEGERAIPYHSVMSGRPVTLRVAGPTTLEIVTRLDFDPSMRGTRHYRLAIREGRRRLREVEFHTTKSASASYANLRDRIPSKFDRLQLPIGQGVHDITLDLTAPAGGVAEIHARIPQPVVGNVE